MSAEDWLDVSKWDHYYRSWFLRNSASFDDLVNMANRTLADGVYFLRELGENGCWLQKESSTFRKGPDHMELGRFLHESRYFEVRMMCQEHEENIQ